ncbi:T-cell ecto-ADP-ribosyltransferase 1-like isoform X1 [Anguilla rostrata]|uniref:T-cell ecto-ADP-ribosyltransferase 1-like isoform X1 n=2 Tax=Anguilla rostrata TaxID=7938 RepID=UPI0030CB4C57
MGLKATLTCTAQASASFVWSKRKRDPAEAMEVQREKVIKLLIIAAIMHTVDSEERQLDMSPNAVDDQFIGCRDDMLNRILGKGGLLEQEQTTNALLKERIERRCQEAIPNGQKEHAQALKFYTHAKPGEFLDAFRSALQSQGGNATAYQGFQFKALHFLLTDALQLQAPKGCATVYHVSKHTFQARVGEKVRFGMFISAYSEYEDELLPESAGTVFSITSCAAVDVDTSACYPDEVDLLIPPFEEFRVLNVTNVGVHRKIYLNHTRLYSSHNCLLLRSGSSSDPVNSSMLLLLAASLYLCCYCLGHAPL